MLGSRLLVYEPTNQRSLGQQVQQSRKVLHPAGSQPARTPDPWELGYFTSFRPRGRAGYALNSPERHGAAFLYYQNHSGILANLISPGILHHHPLVIFYVMHFSGQEPISVMTWGHLGNLGNS